MKPVTILQGKFNNSRSAWLRSGLVVFQFSISIILFIGTFIIYGQLKYVQEKNLGFDKDHVLVIQRAWAIEKQNTFKTELMKNPHIVNASYSDDIPGRNFGQTVFVPENSPSAQKYILAIMSTGYDFDKTMKQQLIEGRYFSKDHPTDSLAIVLNESAIKLMEIKNPVGKRITLPGRTSEQNVTYSIIGVLKDFHFESLHQKIRPLGVLLKRGLAAYMPIRLKVKDIQGSVSFIEKEWKKFVPDKPFDYFFLNDDFNKLYQSEQKTGEIFTSFSILDNFYCMPRFIRTCCFYC